MRIFYFLLWFRWGIRLILCSVTLALLISFIITVVIYIKQGSPIFSPEVFIALFNIIKFWFPLAWSITLLVALFRSLKYLFNIDIKGYKLLLLNCSLEVIEEIGYGDLVKVWRKWFMSMIWLVSIQMLLALSFTYFLKPSLNIFDWFNIYILFVFILFAGFIALVLLTGRCKRIRVIKC